MKTFALIVLLAAAFTAQSAGAASPAVYDARVEGRAVLTPPAPAAPLINTPEVYGRRPGRPFIYRIPATGVRPMRFSAENLPGSLKLNTATGILTGRAPAKPGEYTITIHAANSAGKDARRFTVVAGEKLALTPPMGWNHWYTHYHFITDAKVRAAADAMVSSGMADAGYAYVSIDDCWMRIAPDDVPLTLNKKRTASTGLDVEAVAGAPRDADGRMIPNNNFPDMAALTAYIHSYGLKAGIYTSPGPRTCQEFAGSYQHERIDAETYARWGFDLLKYDWCRYGEVFAKLPEQGLAQRQQPYKLMGEILGGLDRDILYNLCQYGAGDVWEWGPAVGGHSWRIGGDLGHTLTEGGVYKIARKTIGLRAFNGPGQWNDPDYVILGKWVNPFDKAKPPAPVQLTPNEQYSYMSLWCLMASPLFFSGDMGEIDAFTRNILCNREMIAVNQDRLGQTAAPVHLDEDYWVLRKDLADGTVVVGFFDIANSGDRQITVSWADLGFKGPKTPRDLWRQRDLPPADGAFSVKIGPHGAAVIQFR